jgi:uncharacterized protein (TIGR02246 family)
MSNRPASKVGALLAALVATGVVAGLNGWLGSPPERSASGAPPRPRSQDQAPKTSATKPARAAAGVATQSQEEKEIRAFDDLYTRDFNAGDAKALVARFTEDAEVVEDDGLRYRGRELIEERLAETLVANRGAKMTIEIDGVHVLSPDVAKEEGRTIVTPAEGGPPSHRRYTTLLVRRDGKWLISSLREEHDPMVSPHDRLGILSWMVGDWIDEGPDSVVRVNCRWSADRNFLLRTFTVKSQGKDVMTVTQRIGWDPAAKQIRSWEFDSEGGFGEGKWGGDGDRWVIKHTAVRPEGTTVSATNTMVRERPDLVRWSSTERYVGHEPVPDEPSFAFVRVPGPPPAQATEKAAAPAASKQPEGSPK